MKSPSNNLNPSQKTVLQLSSNEKAAEAAVSAQQTDANPSPHLTEQEIERLKQQLQEAKDTHNLRLKYTGRIFVIGCIWLGLVASAVFMSGFSLLGFSLSGGVLIAFITSTTLNVVGLFIVVAKWMFPHNHHQ